MKKWVHIFVILLVIAIAEAASNSFLLFTSGFGKTVDVREISFPEEIVMDVGDEEFVPITMITDKGEEVPEKKLEKICKQYKMVWMTTDPEVVLATRNGQLIAKAPGEVELTATSYNSYNEKQLKTSVKIVVEP